MLNRNRHLLKTNILDVKVSRSQNKIVEAHFSQKTIERICFSILTVRKYLKLEFRFQVSSISGPSGQKIKSAHFFLNLLTFTSLHGFLQFSEGLSTQKQTVFAIFMVLMRPRMFLDCTKKLCKLNYVKIKGIFHNLCRNFAIICLKSSLLA